MNDMNPVRDQIGMAPRPRFVEGPPPREVNMNLIRALHRGQLPAEEEVEIEDLITYFREWHDADRQVLLEFAAGFAFQQERTAEGPKAQPRPAERNVGVGRRYFSSSHLRRWLTVATAATILIAAGLMFWAVHETGNARIVAQLNDPFGRVTKLRGGELVGLDAFPQNYREPIGKMLRTEQVAVPEEQLESMHVTRGSGPSMYVQPVSTVVKSDRPTFEWKSSGDGAKYQVVVYEVGEPEPVVVSSELKGTRWQSDKPLKRGGEYSWDVTVMRDEMPEKPPATRAMFRVLNAAELANIEAQEWQAKGSHLVLAVIYLQAALLDDARHELESLKTEKGESTLVNKLLESLKEHR